MKTRASKNRSKPPTHKAMLRRLTKHLQLTEDEVIQEAIKDLYSFNFNE